MSGRTQGKVGDFLKRLNFKKYFIFYLLDLEISWRKVRLRDQVTNQSDMDTGYRSTE